MPNGIGSTKRLSVACALFQSERWNRHCGIDRESKAMTNEKQELTGDRRTETRIVMTRRELLYASAVGTLAMLPAAGNTSVLAAQSNPNSTILRAGAKSLILIWLSGGASHLDTFDPKPEAHAGIRSPFGAIKTNVDGVRVSALLPRMALRMSQVALIRTVSHAEGSHERATTLIRTGHQPSPNCVHPTMEHNAASVFQTASNSARDGLAGSLSSISSLSAKQDDIARKRYGNSAFGRDCFHARQAIEAGQQTATIVFPGWDSHSDSAGTAAKLVPSLDQGLSALLDDLTASGKLTETLVVCLTEFGRTPHLNCNGGRDHWPDTGFAVMAGAGISGGQVIGATDRIGAEPLDRVISPADLAATIYARLGIPTSSQNENGVAISELS